MKGILTTLQEAGFEAYVAGGAVRDLWLGLEPKDFDLASSATPEEIEKLFPRTEGVGKQFGIMIVVTDGGPIEVARFRADAEYKDGRHPTAIEFSSSEEDAKRRDFTINALFYDTQKGEVIDYASGIEDLEKKLIRCVGDSSQRFAEDSLRMLRAVRFHSQLRGFTLDPELMQAIRKQSKRLSLVSRERITQEVGKIFLSPQPSVGLFDLVLTSLWAPVFHVPEPNAAFHTQFDGLSEIYSELTGKKPSLALFVAAASIWLPAWKPEESFVLSKEQKNAIRAVPSLIPQLEKYLQLERAQKKLLLAEPFVEEAITIMRVSREDAILDQLDEAEEDRARWSTNGALNPPPLLAGADLLALGHSAGPGIKSLLDKVRYAQLSEEISTKEEALTWLKGLN